MKRNSTTRKTKLTHLTWLGTLIAAVILFATCYDYEYINQPDWATASGSFNVSVKIVQDGEGDFAYALSDYGVLGFLIPDGWTVNDGIAYTVTGVFFETGEPYEYIGTVSWDEDYAQMYEDSVGSTEGYYWWGGLSSDTAAVDNLESIMYTVTFNTDDQTGEFNLQYAFGTLDDWTRTPVALMSDPMPITIYPANVEEALVENVSVYPNPASDRLTVDMGNTVEGTVQLMDITGKILFEEEISGRINNFDISKYESGIYFLRVESEGNEFSQKLFVE